MSPDQSQCKPRVGLPWVTFPLVFLATMYLLNTLALLANHHSTGDVLIGAPITAVLETLVVVTVLRLGFWLFSRLPARKR